MMNNMRSGKPYLVAMATVTAMAAVAAAAPSISSTSGTFSHDNSVTISGSGFGSKATAAPIRWETFEDGQVGTNIETTSYWDAETPAKTTFADSSAIRRTSVSPIYIHWLSNQAYPNNTRPFHRDNIGFASTGKAYVNMWLKIDFRDGVDTGYDPQIKLYGIHPNTDHSSCPLLMDYVFTNLDWNGSEAVYYSVFWNDYGSWDSVYFGGGSVAEHYWVNYQIVYEMSDVNTANGRYWVYHQRTPSSGGAYYKQGEDDAVTYGSSDTEGLVDCLSLGYLTVNGPTDTSSYWDDIYIDKYFARVEVGDASTYDGCSHREIQIPTSWSSSSVAIDVNTGAMSSGTAYLYVIDDDNVPNSTGYQITIGGGTTYTLTVNSGTGDGNYSEDQVANISADTAPSGQEFDEWVGDTSEIASVTSSSTTLTMPDENQEITATYQALSLYSLTVNSGTGDGTYQENWVVDIEADSAASGYAFDEWVGDTTGIASVTTASTTITMPGSAAEVTATYEAAASYVLTVNSGTGDGNYSESTVVDIDADTAVSGKLFDAWIGDTANISDVNDPSGTLTMPASNQEITATYTWVVSGLVSRFTFDTDARDTYGTNDGTLTGGASVTNDGTRGKVVSLDGTDDYVSLPSSAIAAGRSELTLSMWVKPDTWVSGDTLYDEYAEGAYWQFTLIYGGFCTRDSSTGTTGGRNNDISMPSLSTGTWQHIAVTYSTTAGEKVIYLDGSENTSSSTSIDTLTSTRTGVGLGYACDGTYFDGMVDDLRLYNRVLNSTELALLAETSVTEYTLTVNSGTGDDDYEANEIANISADTAPSGQDFDEWVGDTSGIASVTSSSTTLTMPAADQEVTATYTDKIWALTVNSGTGDGNYVVGAIADIDADEAPSGQEFEEWVGDTEGIASVTTADSTLTMPYANVEITATYTDKTWTLTVNSGTGDGNYVVGVVADIDADAPASGKQFDAWTGDVTGIPDVNVADTTLTMPYADAEITATYEDIPTYALTVNNGSGDGSYPEDQVVDITADAAPSGQDFDEWTGDTSGIADTSDPTTTITMAASAAEVTATYTDKTWTLTVHSGTGDGSYAVGTIQPITADSAPSGQDFDEWTGDVTGVADVEDPTTTITMPYADAEITATYTDKTWTLTVNSGTGDGSYVVGTVADIDADAPASGKQFDAWTGDVTGIPDVNVADTTLTMPYAHAEITATYEDIPAGYTLTVNSGTGDGDYSESTLVDIDADAAASGMLFDAWTGDTSNISDVNDPSGTLTMPASSQEITATYTWVVSGLVSRFTFDTDARDTYGTNDGTLSGASVVNDGARGMVASFDGTDDIITFPTSGMTAGRSELTLSMWIKPDEDVSTNCIYDAHDNWYWQFAIRHDKWYTRDSSTGTTGSRDNDLSMPSLTTSTWQHLAFVYSASAGTKTIYLDGEQSTSTSTSVDTLTSDRDDELLSLISDGTYYDGMMDDVRLYSRALNSTEIAYLAETAATEYTLTVNSGTGDGDYAEDAVADIEADVAPSGQDFDEWVGDTAGIASVSTADTTLTMPAANQEITATYTDKTWMLTVNSGTGDGSYVVGAVADIDADTPASGKQFDEWIGDTVGIANVTTADTTLTMPYANAEITATYEDIPSGYTLTVNSGTGDGNYSESAVVDIDADAAASGYLFDAWTGDTSNIPDVNDPSGTLTMPASSQEITATYTPVVSGLVSRFTFDTDARDTYGTNDGTLSGATVVNDGARGKVLSLDGTDDYVDLPEDEMCAGRSELTLTMWIYPDEWVGTNSIYDEHIDNWWQFSITQAGWYTRDSSTGLTGSRNNDLSMPSISTGQWTHLAFVYSASGNEKTIYVDGEEDTSTSTSIDTLTSDRTDARVGWPSDGSYLDGKIDDVRLYNRALSSSEIELLAE